MTYLEILKKLLDIALLMGWEGESCPFIDKKINGEITVDQIYGINEDTLDILYRHMQTYNLLTLLYSSYGEITFLDALCKAIKECTEYGYIEDIDIYLFNGVNMDKYILPSQLYSIDVKSYLIGYSNEDILDKLYYLFKPLFDDEIYNFLKKIQS